MGIFNRRWLKPQPPIEAQPHPDTSLPIDAVDKLAARWVASLPASASGAVFSPVGVWPLLAILADVASPAVRSDLIQALGLSKSSYESSTTIAPNAELEGTQSQSPSLTEEAQALIHVLNTSAGTSSALGLWISHLLEVREECMATLPTATLQVLTGDQERDSAALAKWAKEKTSGTIPDLKVTTSPATLVCLASAVTMSTAWQDEFKLERQSGHLMRMTRDASIIRASPDVTTVCVQGKGKDNGKSSRGGAHDVYLVLGKPDASPSAVLTLGLNAIRGRGAPVLTKDAAEKYAKSKSYPPGLVVQAYKEFGRKEPDPYVEVQVPPFDVQARTNLVSEAFGLARAALPGDHFPGMASNLPLMVSDGFQVARAGFGERGFEASAYSMMGRKLGAALIPEIKHRVVRIWAIFDRPFGFLAVDRESGLLLFAGWVTENEWRR